MELWVTLFPIELNQSWSQRGFHSLIIWASCMLTLSPWATFVYTLSFQLASVLMKSRHTEWRLWMGRFIRSGESEDEEGWGRLSKNHQIMVCLLCESPPILSVIRNIQTHGLTSFSFTLPKVHRGFMIESVNQRERLQHVVIPSSISAPC